MKIIINDQEIICEKDSNPADIWNQITQYLRSNDLVIVQQKVNGELFNGEIEQALGQYKVDLLELEVNTAENLIKEMHLTALDFLPKFSESLQEIVILLQEGKDGEAVRMFISSLEGFEWITALLGGMLRNDARAQVVSAECANNYNRVLGQLLNAWENRDLVLVSDILEYEIVPLVDEILSNVKIALPVQ